MVRTIKAIRFNRARCWLAVVVMLTASMAFEHAAAQVVIDMPPPKPVNPAPSLASAGPGVAALPVIVASQIDIGDLALRRYSRGRTYPYDTYWNGPTYAGIQQYSFPFPLFWWGGFWPWWGGSCFVNTCP